MNQVTIHLSVQEATAKIKQSLNDKGMTIFAEIDHQKNAQDVELEMPESQVIIFGNPLAGTKLMQKDMTMSFDLPLRIAVFEQQGKTVVMHQTSDDFCENYDVKDHPVLEKVAGLFATLINELSV